jgi:hypothetical protein
MTSLLDAPGLEFLKEPWADRAPDTTRYPDQVERWRPDVEARMPQALRDRPDAATLVDKYLYAMTGESDGNPTAIHDGGNGYGLMADRISRTPVGTPAAQQIQNGWSLVQNDLQQGGTGFGDWGEGRLYNGQPFGSMGVHPYGGGGSASTSAPFGAGDPLAQHLSTGQTANFTPPETTSTTVARARMSADEARQGAEQEQLRAQIEATTGGALGPTLPHEDLAMEDGGTPTVPLSQPGDIVTGQEQQMQQNAILAGPTASDFNPPYVGSALQQHLSSNPQPLDVTNPSDYATLGEQVQQATAPPQLGETYDPTGQLTRERANAVLGGPNIAERGLSTAADLYNTTVPGLPAVRSAVQPVVSAALNNPVGEQVQGPYESITRPLAAKLGVNLPSAAELANPVPTKAGDVALLAYGPGRAALEKFALSDLPEFLPKGPDAFSSNAPRVVNPANLPTDLEAAMRVRQEATRAGMSPYKEPADAGTPPSPYGGEIAAPRPGETDVGRYRTPGMQGQTVGGGAPTPAEEAAGAPKQLTTSTVQGRPQDVTKPVADVPLPTKAPSAGDFAKIPQPVLDSVALEPPPKGEPKGYFDQPDDVAKTVVVVHNDPRLEAAAEPSSGKAQLVGNLYVGGLPTSQQLMDLLETQHTPEQLHEWAAWYETVKPAIKDMYEAQTEAALERLTQANVSAGRRTSPERAAGDVLDQEDRLAGHEREGLGSMNRDIIEPSLQGSRDISGHRAKLNDYGDSMNGKETRSWAGDDPRAEGPYTADTHQSRLHGYIDGRMGRYIAEKLGLPDASPESLATVGLKYDVKPDKKGVYGSFSPSDNQYELINRAGNQWARDANAAKWLGKSDWKPAQLQAMGWGYIKGELGDTGGDWASVLKANLLPVTVDARSQLAVQYGWDKLPEAARGRATGSFIQQAVDHMKTEMPLARVKQINVDPLGQASLQLFASEGMAGDVAKYLSGITSGGEAISWRAVGGGPVKTFALDMPELTRAERAQFVRDMEPHADNIAVTEDGSRVWLLGTSLNKAQVGKAALAALQERKIEADVIVNDRQEARVVVAGASYGRQVQQPESGHLARALASASQLAPEWAAKATTGAILPSSSGGAAAGTTGTSGSSGATEASQPGNRPANAGAGTGPAGGEPGAGVGLYPEGADPRFDYTSLEPKSLRVQGPGEYSRGGYWISPQGQSYESLGGSHQSALVSTEQLRQSRLNGTLEGSYIARGDAAMDEVMKDGWVRASYTRSTPTIRGTLELEGANPQALAAAGRKAIQAVPRSQWDKYDIIIDQHTPDGLSSRDSVYMPADQWLRQGTPTTGTRTPGYTDASHVGPVSGISYTGGGPSKPTSGPQAKAIDAAVEKGELGLTKKIGENLKRQGLTLDDWKAMNTSMRTATPEWELNQNPQTTGNVTTRPTGDLESLKAQLAQDLNLAAKPGATASDMRAALERVQSSLRGPVDVEGSELADFGPGGVNGFIGRSGGHYPAPYGGTGRTVPVPPRADAAAVQARNDASAADPFAGLTNTAHNAVTQATTVQGQNRQLTVFRRNLPAVRGQMALTVRGKNYRSFADLLKSVIQRPIRGGDFTPAELAGLARQIELPGMPERPAPELSDEQQAELEGMQRELDAWRVQTKRDGYPADWSPKRILNYENLLDAQKAGGLNANPNATGITPENGQLPGTPPAKTPLNLLQEFGALLGIPQTVMASVDLSGTLRPGMRGAVLDRTGFQEAFQAQVKAFLNDAEAQLAMTGVKADKWYGHGQQRGVHMFPWGPEDEHATAAQVARDVFEKDVSDLTPRQQEQVDRIVAQQNDPGNRVTGYTGVGRGRISHFLETSPLTLPLRASERARAVFLNVQGQSLYSMMANAVSATDAFKALSNADKEKWFKSLARITNELRGYGSFNPGQVVPGINAFFGGRSLVSLFEQPFEVLRAPGSLFEPSPRQFAAKGMANLTGLMVGVLGTLGLLGAAAGGLWSVQADPLAGDFGQFRMGNTRIDLMGGYGPIVRIIARGVLNAAGKGRPNENMGQALVNFFRNKESPLVALLTNTLSGANSIGQGFKPTPQNLALMFIPLMAQATAEAALINKGGSLAKVGYGSLAGIAEIFGGGANTYQSADDLKKEYTSKLAKEKGWPVNTWDNLNYGQRQDVQKAIDAAGKGQAKTGVPKAAQDFKDKLATAQAGFEKAWKEGTLGSKKLTDVWGDLNQQRLGSSELQKEFYGQANIDPSSDFAKRFTQILKDYSNLRTDPSVTDENGVTDFQALKAKEDAFKANLSTDSKGGAVSDRDLLQSYQDYAKSQKSPLERSYQDFLDKKDSLGYQQVKPTDSEDVKAQKNATNKQLDIDHPEMDAAAWRFGSGQDGVTGGTLTSKAAVDQVLKMIDTEGLGKRTVSFEGESRNLNTPAGRTLWNAEGQNIADLFDDKARVAKNPGTADALAAKDFATRANPNPKFSDLNATQKTAVISTMRGYKLEDDPKLDALHAYFGFSPDNAKKTFSLHSRAADAELAKLETKYGATRAKDGYTYTIPGR